MQFYYAIFADATNAISNLKALNVGEGEDTTEGTAL